MQSVHRDLAGNHVDAAARVAPHLAAAAVAPASAAIVAPAHPARVDVQVTESVSATSS